MDRIEDETIRYIYFLQAVEGEPPPMPFSDEEEGGPGSPALGSPAPWGSQPGEEVEAEAEGASVAAAAPRYAPLQPSIEDFTRKIQRKKEKELAEIQMAGSDSSSSSQKTVFKGAKVGRNDPCPCGSGKKYKKCCGASA